MWEKQKEIEKYMDERGWTDRNPANLAKSISIEAAELLEHFQWNHKTKEEVTKDKKLTKEISHEVADIVIYCFDMAVALGFDLEGAVSQKLDLVKKKYPVKKVKGDSAAYYAIKKAYRVKKK
jgi:NTP pyrophosphatase (non-canonical NTP hydrolase)